MDFGGESPSLAGRAGAGKFDGAGARGWTVRVAGLLDTRELILLAWTGAASAGTFLLWGYDKWQAGRQGGRIAEAALCVLAALGGWPGGLAGMAAFRHKTRKASFQLKFAAAFVVWILLAWAALTRGGRP